MNQQLLHERFEYKDGNLIWKIKSSPKTKIGDVAGNLSVRGYVVVQINGKTYKAHRLVWIYHNGDIPAGIEIDHINEVKNDNRIDNLRLATSSQNKCNVSKPKRNTSGFKGVTYSKAGKRKWVAQISINNKNIYLGCRDTKEAAYELYKAATIKYHGEFARCE
jgi:hypothetical protein